jgi:hypothetical protein
MQSGLLTELAALEPAIEGTVVLAGSPEYEQLRRPRLGAIPEHSAAGGRPLHDAYGCR